MPGLRVGRGGGADDDGRADSVRRLGARGASGDGVVPVGRRPVEPRPKSNPPPRRADDDVGDGARVRDGRAGVLGASESGSAFFARFEVDIR